MPSHTKTSTEHVPTKLSLFDNNSVFNSNASPSGPRPLRMMGGPLSPGPSTAPLAYSSANFNANLRKSTERQSASRRQSSISYISSSDRDFKLRSAPLLERRSSLGFSGTENTFTKGEEVSDSLVDESSRNTRPSRQLTLAEKHADLLHFIAQKESKCLELRSQLATHEAELLNLKRKWEQIVSKGFGNGSLVDVPGTPAAKQTPVLEGIKEGVQGVGRFIAGLSDLTPQSPTLNRAPAAKEIKRQSVSSVSTYSTSKTRLSESSMSSFDTTDEVPESCPKKDKDLMESISKISVTDKSSTSYDIHDLDISESPTLTTLSFEQGKTLLRRRSRDKSTFKTSSGITAEKASLKTIKSPTMDAPDLQHNSVYSKKSLPSPASISSLSTISVAAANVPQISSWVGTVGKKIEELQKGQKRASIMFSDVSSSFFAAFSSPPPSATTTSPKLPSLHVPPSPDLTTSVISTSTSWLDDDESSIDNTGSKSTLDNVIALTPDLLSRSAGHPCDTASLSEHINSSSTGAVKKREVDDDDWNW